MNEREIKQI